MMNLNWEHVILTADDCSIELYLDSNFLLQTLRWMRLSRCALIILHVLRKLRESPARDDLHAHTDSHSRSVCAYRLLR